MRNLSNYVRVRARLVLPEGITCSCVFQMQRIPEICFSATLGEEPEVELALV